MRETEKIVSWVVYRKTIHSKVNGVNAVCEQGEWEAMESLPRLPHAHFGRHYQRRRSRKTGEE